MHRAARSGWRVAAGLLVVVAALLALPLQAQAQTLTTFVSNTNETANPRGSNATFFAVASFLAASDIVVSGIEISLGQTGEAVLKIRENSADDLPGELVAELTSPATLTADSLTTFTAPAGTTLAAGETYWITWGEGVLSWGDLAGITTTDSDNETGETGWEIGDGHLWRFSETGTWSTSARALMFAIKGTINEDTTLSNDATLSALALADDGGNAVALNETFDTAETTYTASVANTVETVTLTATPTHTGASVSAVTLGGTAIADTDFSDGITVPDLDDGDNVIVVTVTAEDGSTTQDYTLTVTREATTTTTPVTIEAQYDSIGGGLEDLVFTLTREGDTTDALTAKVTIVQAQSWLGDSDLSHTVTFPAGDAAVGLTIAATKFSFSPTASGDLTATVSGDGIDGGSDTVEVVSTSDPPITVGFEMDDYTFAEDATDEEVYAVATLDTAYPRAPSRNMGPVAISTASDTARFRDDFASLNSQVDILANSFQQVAGQFVARKLISEFDILDDAIYEGSEQFILKIESTFHLVTDMVRFQKPDGTVNGTYDVTITDEEDLPVLSLSAAPPSIAEEDDDGTTGVAENVSVLTVAITNGKTFVGEETVTLTFSGTATLGTHYSVSPADADTNAAGHQVVLPAETASVSVTVTATANDSADGNRTVAVAGEFDGRDIGTRDITILDDDTTTTNTAATGQPGITGTPQVGDELTATIGTIADDTDGLPATFPDDYDFQWVRLDSSNNPTNVGENSNTYTVLPTDVDSTIRVDVSFIDGAGNPEDPLSSLAVGPVMALLPELSFADTRVDVDETDGSVELTVNLDRESAGIVTVDYATSNGGSAFDRAVAGEDYTAKSDMLTFAPGETSKTITIQITDDDIHEADVEFFVVDLANPSGATESATAGRTEVHITSEDSRPTASMDDVTVDEGAGTMRLTLQLSHPSSKQILYSTSSGDVGGMATMSEDYVDDFLMGSLSDRTIIVHAGELTKDFDIAIIDDDAAESDETITIKWTKISDGQATPNVLNFTGTITDNDSACLTPNLTGRTQIWTGTVTVGDLDFGGTPAAYGFGTGFGALDNTQFSVGVDGYTVDLAAVDATTSTTAGRLQFSLSGALAATDLAQLTLHVCGDSFALADATVNSTAHTYAWDSAGLDWSSVTSRTLYLSVPTNTAPVVDNPLENQVATPGTAFSYQFPADTFSDANGDTLTYSATRDDGTALPSWLIFADASRTFSGTPAVADVGTVTVKVTASDGRGETVSDAFDMAVVVETTATAPAIVTDGVEVTSTPRATPDTYGLGETIEITVTFDSAVTVDTSGGTPRIQFRLDGALNRWAEYTSGSGGTALVFTYTVQSGDMDDDGIWLEENFLRLRSGTIRAAADNTVDATLTYAEPGLQTGHKVDGSVVPITTGQNGDLQLVGGPDAYSGRLEVFFRGKWGTVCDDRFDRAFVDPNAPGDAVTDANGKVPNIAGALACQLMGHKTGEMVARNSLGMSMSQAPARQKIWLDDVRCSEATHGTVSGLQRCYHAGVGLHNCSHREDVHLRCIPEDTTRAALTAEFQQVPEEPHSGEEFSFRIEFSEPVLDLHGQDLVNGPLMLTGAQPVRVALVDDRDNLLEVTVDPVEGREVTIGLESGHDCWRRATPTDPHPPGAQWTVCTRQLYTPDGTASDAGLPLPLSESVSATVESKPLLTAEILTSTGLARRRAILGTRRFQRGSGPRIRRTAGVVGRAGGVERAHRQHRASE